MRILSTNEDIFQLALPGRYSIEASAGTGKTWTIASLWLRLLICTDISIDHILVLTYTRASVSDLSVRLYERLHAVIAYDVSHVSVNDSVDCFEAYLYRHVGDAALVRRRAFAALACFDQHGICTIHGFCQRVLQSNPIAIAHSEYHLENAKAVLERLVFDYWRVMHHTDWSGPFRERSADIFFRESMRGQGVRPEHLLMVWQQYLQYQGAVSFTQTLLSSDMVAWSDLWSTWCRCIEQLRSDWSARTEIMDLLASAPLHKQRYRPHLFHTWSHEISYWLAVPQAKIPTALEKFSVLALSRATRKGQVPPEHIFFDHVQQLLDIQQDMIIAVDIAKLQWYSDMCTWLSDALKNEQKRLHFFRFDDLVRVVHQALRASAVEDLSESIRRQYPVLLFDESQDTDRQQFDIVDAVWGGHPCVQIFVGDPKQAIYGFRGADVYSYMHFLSRIPPEARYSLVTNYRSAPHLVDAVHALFARRPNPFLSADIVMSPLVSAYQPQLSDSPSSLIIVHPPEEMPVETRSRQVMWVAGAVTEEIMSLCEHIRPSYQGRPCQYRDIAILVRSHEQAYMLYEHCHERGIPVRYRSRQNIFMQEPVLWVESLLMMMCYPFHQGYMRAVLLSPLMGLSLSEIAETPLLAMVDPRSLAQKVRERGFLLVLQSLLYRSHFSVRYAAYPRLQAALFAIAEYLNKQQFSTVFELLQVLQKKKTEAERGDCPDDAVLSADYAEDSVSILTQHTAKGLEFPIVFCPFLGCGPSISSDSVRADGDGGYRFDVDGAPCSERLSEEVRLAYVALTRAKERCYVYWFPYRTTQRREYVYAPLLWLLSTVDFVEWQSQDMTHFFEDNRASLESFISSTPGVEARCFISEDRSAQKKRSVSLSSYRPSTDPIQLCPAWQSRSFTGLSSSFDAHFVRNRLPVGGPDASILPAWFLLSRGAHFGILVHHMMASGRVADISAVLDSLLVRYHHPSEWQIPLQGLYDVWLSAPLFPDGGCYRDVTALYQERDFFFFSESIVLTEMQRVLSACGMPVPEMSAQIWSSSLFKGSIDSIVYYRDRYYIIDWKTNDLGDTLRDYAAAPLFQAMAHHGYAVQGMLYLLAMHLWLSRRVSVYRFEKHFGGMIYVFLRGLHPGYPGLGIWYERPDWSCLQAFAKSVGVIL